MDGALGSYGAALLEPYSDRPTESGILALPYEKLRALARPWAAAGWQIASHAIGDRANRVALDVYATMPARGVRADVVTYNGLVSACEKGGAWAMALGVLRAAEAPNLVTFLAALRALDRQGRRDAAVEAEVVKDLKTLTLH